jgi:hypothetical protein
VLLLLVVVVITECACKKKRITRNTKLICVHKTWSYMEAYGAGQQQRNRPILERKTKFSVPSEAS